MVKLAFYDFIAYWPITIIIFGAIGWIMANSISKSQYVRIIDILIYGPYLLYLATKNTYTITASEKVFLLFLGTTTITYNLRNFIGGL